MDDWASDSEETHALLREARGGDGRAFDRLFARYQPLLQRFVELRIDPKLRPRVDPADVVQEAHLEAVRRLGGFLDNPVMPFRLWIRQIALDRLLMMRRRHVGAAQRSVEREAALPDESASPLAGQLAASASSPSQHAGREELAAKVRAAVARLPDADREIVLMRTFEGLAYEEIARLLAVEPAAARKRHGRALLRLHQLLADDGVTESRAVNPTPTPDDPLLEELTSQAADEFMERLERGESPDLEAFVARHARIAPVLRRLLPALQAMKESHAGTRPAVQTPAAEPERPGRLGDFEIVREVGRGGMGVVYEAVQISLGRRVALKVLPFAAMLDPHRLQRFQNEARAAACLHHGNIVPVFAVGCDRGVHFYAMQYIEGRNLADLVRERRLQAGLEAADGDESSGSSVRLAPRAPRPAAATEPAAALSTQRSSPPPAFLQAAAQLAVQAADALHHAHQEGVVHRDVKPANVMVDSAGRAWVTDFGLAQVQNDPRLTTTGGLVGTLRYMSPEQASGEHPVDHRTDVYSLGATLYELLALRPAFDGRDRVALLRQIAQAEPRPLRRLNPSVPADLETIVAKAMAKSPGDRYATAQALADDLRRFLEDKPILAKRPSPLEKAARWARRRRALVAAAILLLLLAVCGLTVSTVLIGRAYGLLSEEQVKTKKALEAEAAAYDAEARERQRAQEAAWKARQVLNFFTQVTEEDLPDRPDVRPVRRKLLEAELGYYQDFIEQQADDPSAETELLASKWRTASILEEMGAKADALAVFEQVRTALRPAVGPGGFRFGTAEAFGVSGLLTQEAVRQDLKLSEEQAKSISALAEKRRDMAWGRRGSAEDLEANEEACFEVLRPEQAKRLRQIVWQRRGAHVFGDPEAADALALTADQRERIRAIEEDARKNFWGRPGRSGDHRADGWKHSEEFWKDVSDRLLAVLSDGQRAKWKELTGEPFQGEIRFGPPPPDFGPGPHNNRPSPAPS